MGLCSWILPIAVEDYRQYKSMERAIDILERESGSKLAHDAMNGAPLIRPDGWAPRFHSKMRKDLHGTFQCSSEILKDGWTFSIGETWDQSLIGTKAWQSAPGRSEPGQDDASGCSAKRVVKPSRRRLPVDYFCDLYRASERHACRVLRVGRGAYRYQSHRNEWTELRGRILEIARSRVRYGYRKILMLLRRESWKAGKHLVCQFYREEGLALKKRPQKRRKATRPREERFRPTAPDQAWCLDFVADQLQDGRRFRCLTTVDVFTREIVAIEVGQRLRGEDMVRTLNRTKQEGRTSKLLFCDSGSEFSGQALDLWAYQNGVKIDFSSPGTPTDNAFVESFNGTFRDECLNVHWFETLTEAERLIEA